MRFRCGLQAKQPGSELLVQQQKKNIKREARGTVEVGNVCSALSIFHCVLKYVQKQLYLLYEGVKWYFFKFT